MSLTRSVTVMLAALVFAYAFGAMPTRASAASKQDLSITPVVVDKQAKVRDIVEASLTLVNTSDRKLTLYPSVNDIHPETGAQDFSAAKNADDLEASLARWIELSRGVIDMGPGEEKTIPFVIRVNQAATPGLYHAVISFADGSTRESAAQLATATVNLEVQADIKEIMQLNKFTTDNVVFSGDDVLFNYQVQNIGNQDLRPKGEIRIYDRKGEEIASIEVNGDGKNVSPDQVAQLASVWNGAQGFGRYKALLNVDYGSSQTASVQDSVFFWVIPWKQLLGLTVVTLIAIIILALNFHRQLEERHLGKLARAGLLKSPEQAAHTPADIPAHVPAHAVGIASPSASRLRGMLGFLRRGAPPMAQPMSPMPVVQKARIAEVLPVVPRDQMPIPGSITVRTPARSVPAAAPGGTIDLKNMSAAQPAHVIPQAHVINLKN